MKLFLWNNLCTRHVIRCKKIHYKTFLPNTFLNSIIYKTFPIQNFLRIQYNISLPPNFGEFVQVIESSSLFCNNCHSLYFCSIMVTVRVMGCDFERALSVDFHSIHVTFNTLLFWSVIDSIINLVLAVSS